ncbi:hypothetical protein [Chitinophaga agrisoli]|nr:hypothetical protein [Chitinophaga agrisoli]
MRLLWCIIAGMLLCKSVFSQKPGLELPRYTYHTPHVTGLGQYGEYPVSLSTGVPAIDIPLYTVKGSKLELPISVSYHASGIKVDQESSFVGLGWVLNAGGLVTRILGDKPDDGTWGFLSNGKILPDYNSIDHLDGAGTVGNSDDLATSFNSFDKEPDIFNVNAAGFSDAFSLDNTGKFVSMNQEANSYNVNLLTSTIVVKDTKGNFYRFGKALDGTPAFERTSTSTVTTDSNSGTGNPYTSPTYASSYHLTEIISADYSDTISFKYKTALYGYQKVINCARYLLRAGFTSAIDDDGQNFDGSSFTSLTTSIENMQIPDKILFKNGSVEFTSANDRTDVEPAESSSLSLTRITGFIVYDAKRNVIRKVVFQNGDYFSRTAAGVALNNRPILDYRKKSLKLNGVAFYDRNNAFVNDYKFEYDAAALPPRNTTAQDFWGYPNGKANSTLIPQIFFTDDFNGLPQYVGDNRRSDFNYMKAAVLNKITYPTGGYTTYEFEPNYYLTADQAGNKVQQSQTFKVFARTASSECDAIGFLDGVPQNNSLDVQISEDLGASNISAANVYVAFSDYKITPMGQSMTARITSSTTGVDFTFTQTPSEKDQRKTVNQSITISEGDRFKLEANTNGVTGCNTSPCNTPYIEMGITYNYWVTAPIQQINPEPAGGLRVKTITNFDMNGAPVSQRKYEYGDTRYNVGIGTLITEPGKNYYNYPLLYREISIKSLKNLLWFTSDSQVELGANAGCPVNYFRVIEKRTSYQTGESNGRTDYFFSRSTGDFEPKSGFKYPYNTVYYPEWKQQPLLLQTIQYKYENGVYKPVKDVRYDYKELPVKKIKTLKIWDYEPDIHHGSLISTTSNIWFYLDKNPHRFLYYNYYVSCGKYVKTSEITGDYTDGADSLVTKIDYQYNENNDLSKESSTNSKSEATETIYKYTGDLDYTSLISQNMLSLPVQQETHISGKSIAGSILKYNDFGGITERYQLSTPAPVTPVAYTAAATVPPLYERKESVFYNINGKTVQQIKVENSINTIYIWSYANQFPVAEIRNADYATVQAVLGATAITDFAVKNPTPAEAEAFVVALRSDARLKDAAIATYVFDPLVGVISMRDNRNQKYSYDYDAYGRLQTERDQNGSILKQYDYQYQKPITQ